MDREELIRQRAAVVAALERDGLNPEQRARGWKRYDELQEAIQAYYRSEAMEQVKSIRDGKS